ncbi:hypothetical protein BaRGS_00011208 [Batillaria attramentaria]|uniref:Uncharacterized protein n=1 Tax=Batillaria attramentaria TaxID=370345 RepID=A0ABD0LEB7_9CAEN
MEQQDLHSQIAARPKATRESNSQNSPQQMDAEPRPAATCRSSAQTCTVVSGGYPSADPFVTPSGPQPSAARKWTEYHYHYTYVTPSAFSPIMSGTSRGHPPFSRHRAGGLGQVPDTGDPDSRHDSFLDRRWRHYMRASRDYVRASRDFTGCHLSRDDTMYLVAYAQVNESPDEECLRYIGKRVRASDQQILVS